jgi:hypothetical protein
MFLAARWCREFDLAPSAELEPTALPINGEAGAAKGRA